MAGYFVESVCGRVFGGQGFGGHAKLIGSLARLGISKTEPKAESQSSQALKPKPKPKTKKNEISARFGLVFGFLAKRLGAESLYRVGAGLQKPCGAASSQASPVTSYTGHQPRCTVHVGFYHKMNRYGLFVDHLNRFWM